VGLGPEQENAAAHRLAIQKGREKERTKQKVYYDSYALILEPLLLFSTPLLFVNIMRTCIVN
jgi:hypothetical protein